jgi:hypothetical protein
MKLAHDPDFKFTIARSIYKTILRFEAEAHGEKSVVVQPPSPENFSITLTPQGVASLTWVPQKDSDESTAMPTGYNVYMAAGNLGYDNGTPVQQSRYTLQLMPDVLYRFRITATNAGGESFPTEELCVLFHSPAAKTVMIVNCFQRLSSPAVHDGYDDKGFDINEDPGVSYGLTAGWCGQQQVFSTATAGSEGPGTFGYSGQELQGKFIAGNDFNYIRTHADAIATSQRYAIASCSRQALMDGDIKTENYNLIDLILGLERNDGYSLRRGEAFPTLLRTQLQQFTAKGGSLLVSGSYVGRDMPLINDSIWLADVLKCDFGGTDTDSLQRDSIRGMGTEFLFYRHLNEQHYAATHPDILMPIAPAYSAMLYADDYSACVAYDGADYRAFTMGFPFECIESERMRQSLMRGILNFLLKTQ